MLHLAQMVLGRSPAALQRTVLVGSAIASSSFGAPVSSAFHTSGALGASPSTASPRKITGYNLYMQQALPACKVENPGLTPQQRLTKIAAQYKELSEGQKAELKVAAAAVPPKAPKVVLPKAPRAPTAFNIFMQQHLAARKAAHPDAPHREAFKLVANSWSALSPEEKKKFADGLPALKAPSK